ERYGPEAIVYPDLRGNPRADLWLWQRREAPGWRDILPPDANPRSHAGIFPNTFVALVPRGGGDGLDRLEHVADAARRQARARGHQRADLAKQSFLEQAERRSASMTAAQRRAFDQAWERQHENVLFTSWSAVAWPELEPIEAWRARHASWIPRDAL